MVGIKLDNEFLQALDEKMDEVAENIFNNSQINIVDKGIIDEGTLLKSGNINRGFLEKEVIYTAPYAESIEFGRLPGSQPPVEPITNWVIRKGITPKRKEAEKVAWAIVTDIRKDGVMPRPFFGPAIKKELERLKAR